jgi:hypothetical protein
MTIQQVQATTIQQVQATLERQTATIIQLRSEKAELARKVTELTQFQSLFSRLEEEIVPLRSLESRLSERVNQLTTDLEAALQLAKSQAEQPERTMGERLVAGKVAFLAIAAFTGALVVAKNPEAFKDAAVKGGAFVAEKASSVARWSVSAFFNKGIEIDLT